MIVARVTAVKLYRGLLMVLALCAVPFGLTPAVAAPAAARGEGPGPSPTGDSSASPSPAPVAGEGIEACGLEDPDLPEPPVPVKAGEVAGLGKTGLPVVRRMVGAARIGFGQVGHGAAGGALSGKTVYLSAGHGWYHHDSLGWLTQRGNTNGIIEDLVSTETVSQYLIRYLRNMGAYVVPMREPDLNTNRVVVDDGDDGFATEGDVTLADGPEGWGHLAVPITGQENPFHTAGSKLMTTAETATGRAVWTFDVPESGAYNVYVGWVQEDGRAADAHYIVRHAGGETHFRVDQRRHGSTWVLLGRFYFEAGTSPARGAVVLANDSAMAGAGATVSADVARIGGGVGVIDRGGGDGVVGRPRFEIASRYHCQLAGAPASVYDARTVDNDDDVVARSRFSDWEHEAGEDAVYVAWHTNATGSVPSTARGTEIYAYGPSAPPGPLSEFSGVPGSLELMDAIHSELIGDLRKVWDPEWVDRGQHTAFFGEVNPDHNDEMPATLIEVAFHSTPADADSLRDPRFRNIAARAIAQGIARYFAQKDGADLTLPPEPPTAVRMAQGDGDTLTIAWQPPAENPAGGDPAASYRVYLSQDGLAFDSGQDVAGTSTTIPMPPSAELYARVTAVNAGGESFPSPVVGARLAAADKAQVLVVDGYQRLDRFMAIPDPIGGDLGTVDRVYVARMNDGSYVGRFGAAIAAAGVSFDSASADAVAAGDVSLGDYTAVVWYLGEESSGNDPLSATERDAITGYVDGGGSLFISGAEIGWSLVDRGTPETQMFYGDVLGAMYVSDDADTYSVSAADTGPFAGMADIAFDDLGDGGYDADFPDVIAPVAGGDAVLAYSGGTGGTAAVLRSTDGGGQVLVLGFPFETVAGADARAEVMARVLAGFAIEPDQPPIVGGDGGPRGPDGGMGTDGGIDNPATGDAAGGCGCQVGHRGAPINPLALFALLALFPLMLARARLRRKHP